MKTRNIHRFLVAISLLFVGNQLLTAQATPTFAMPLYCRDAVGHIDSVIIGHNRESNLIGVLNPNFGEVPISMPFDSIFEMRVQGDTPIGHLPGLPLTKTAISIYEDSCGTLGVSAFTKVLVYGLYKPFTFSWDKNLLNTGSSACSVCIDTDNGQL